MRICENGVYRDATPEEITALEQAATQQPTQEQTSEERIAALESATDDIILMMADLIGGA